ncbi:MAG: SMC family ATPase [Bacteroidota bacterium]
MIPVSLSIEGLYSYQAKQEIDFTQLTRAQIFGIFGATGSGKSSILEAIAFALYGQSERLNQKDNRAYNMMNLKSNRLLIDFDFGVGEEQYKVVVQVKRNSKQFDKVGTFERKAFRYEQGQPVPMADFSPEAILGLTYENFKRTIIIPQGKFQEFLQLTTTDRTRMLKEIFKLEKFELHGKTAALEKRNNADILTQETLLAQLADKSEEKAQELQASLEEKSRESEQLIADLAAKEKEASQQEELKQRFQELTQTREQFQQIEAQSASFAKREQTLNDYLACLNEFQKPLEKRRQIREQIELAERQLQEKGETLKQVQTDLHSRQQAFARIETQYHGRDQMVKQMEEFEVLQQMLENLQIIQSTQGRVQNGEAKVKEEEENARNIRKDIQQEESDTQALRKQMVDSEEILELQQWFQEQTQLKQQMEREQQGMNQLQQEIAEALQEKNRILQESFLDPRQYDLPTKKILDLIASSIHQHETDLRETEKSIRQALLSTQLHQLKADLKPGDPCPLCGSTDHDPAFQPPLSEEVEPLETQREHHLQTLSSLNKLFPSLDFMARQSETLGARQKQHQAALQSCQNALDSHQATFKWETQGKSPEEEVKRLLSANQALKEQIIVREQRLDTLRKNLQDTDERIERYRPTLEQLKATLAQKKGEINSQKALIKTIQVEQWMDKSKEQVNTELIRIQHDLQNLENLYTEQKEELQNRQKQLHQLEGELAALRKQRDEALQSQARHLQSLKVQVDASRFTNLTQIQALLDLNLNIDAEKDAIKAFQESRTQLRSRIEQLESQTKGLSFNQEAFGQLQAVIQDFKAKQRDLMIEIGARQKELEKLREDLLRKQGYEKELEKLRLRGEDIRLLKNMFKGSGFVNYVSSIFLQNLCQAANQRFRKLTRGSLSLEAAANNSFQVRDFLHEGQLRSVKTLSGGQTFQAALSLALSLAEQVQQQARSEQNFFFLDEGFGSQDRNSLQVIFQTLKALRKENRIVGIISHVEELQQEIDTYLHIANDPEKGSKITPSWES